MRAFGDQGSQGVSGSQRAGAFRPSREGGSFGALDHVPPGHQRDPGLEDAHGAGRGARVSEGP